MINGKTITLLVPCRNEAGIIASFLGRVPACVDEVLIVDNNSTDRTVQIARKHGARVVCETRTTNGIGYGFAHMTGITQATGDYIVAMDGDDTYPLESIGPVVGMMEERRFDMVSCNRLPLTNPNAISRTRQLGIHILNMLVRTLYGFPIKDILTGMWVIRRDVALSLTLREGDWNFSPEIKLEALARKDIRFAEYHIHHFERAREPSKQDIFRTGFAHAWYILERRFTRDSVWYELLQSTRLVFER